MNRERSRARGRTPVRSLAVAVLAVAASLAGAPAAPRPAAPMASTNPCPQGTAPRFPGADVAAASCVATNAPESGADLLLANQQLALRSAPDGSVLPGANAGAIEQAAAIAAQGHRLPGADGTWQPYGQGPLVGDDPRFTRVANAGYPDLNGRVNHFAADPATGRLYASVGQGGVWTLDPGSTTWRSIGENLPTQAVGGLAFSPAAGGTILVTTGNDVFGGGTTFAGVGAFRSLDGGRTWQHASGIPDGVNSFQVAVDPTNPNVVYAATGGGLFRSTDDGVSYVNVDLPVTPAGTTPNCAGALPTVEGCFLANIVTDVVVRAPGGVGADTSGGEVIAAVGWRAGSKTNTSQHYPSYVESPGNGLYRSQTGAPNSFTKIDTTASNFADGQQAGIGRIELGEATGASQDHSYLYAIVQDANPFQGGSDIFGLDAPGANGVSKTSTYLKGVYSSSDWGTTWTKMATPTQLAAPGTGTTLSPGLACNDPRALYCPGVQAWYNAWIKPDPTRADASGVPTRLVFGLEELWENALADQGVGASGPQPFKVIASYIGGTQCFFLVLQFPACPTESGYGSTTLHADQHDGIFLPDGSGGVSLYAGNDGGVGMQHVSAGQALSNAQWGRGLNHGFNTLMTYSAVMAKDGTVYAGLQDNGELRIEPSGKEFNTHDGDGTTSAVDPNNSDIVYERPAGAAIQKSVDGGKTWTPMTTSDTWQFDNPMSMDPLNSQHLLDAGNKVWESNDGGTNWTSVFTLGAAPSGVNYGMSALDVRSVGSGALPTGPHTPNFTYTDGAGTIPEATSGGPAGDVPGSYVEHPFTIGANDGDAQVTVHIQWASYVNDWDLYLYRIENGSEVLVQSSPSSNLQTMDPSETVVVPNPPPGQYVIRVVNSTATGTFDASTTFVQRTQQVAADLKDSAYVAFCGTCDPLNTRPVATGIATNVGGSQPPSVTTANGWHRATAAGLPQRFITSISSDPADPRTVYVTLGGYSRRWLPPGAVYEQPDPRSGHVFKSTDAGEHFTNISGNLPDAPVESLLAYNGGLIVGTDNGVFISPDAAGSHWETLGNGLPAVPVFSVALKPKASAAEPDLLYVGTHGRGVYTYSFATQGKPAARQVIPLAGGLPNSSAVTTGGGAALAVLGVVGGGLLALRRRRRRAA